MSETFMTAEEVRELTGRTQSPAQVRVLRSMGIEHRVRADGKLVLLRAHVDQVLGMLSVNKKNKAPTEPNWGALNGSRAHS